MSTALSVSGSTDFNRLRRSPLSNGLVFLFKQVGRRRNLPFLIFITRISKSDQICSAFGDFFPLSSRRKIGVSSFLLLSSLVRREFSREFQAWFWIHSSASVLFSGVNFSRDFESLFPSSPRVQSSRSSFHRYWLLFKRNCNLCVFRCIFAAVFHFSEAITILFVITDSISLFKHDRDGRVYFDRIEDGDIQI